MSNHVFGRLHSASYRRASRVAASSSLAAVLLSLPGCAGILDVPEHMRVREGRSPENTDTNVRFRTTYYFRTFDRCAASSTTGASPVPRTDSVYRFVMTGKASALSKIHFESGVLRESEIDPFGASVELDPDSGRFRYVSRAETESRAHRNEALREIDGLIALRNRLARPTASEHGAQPSAPTPAAQASQDTLVARVNELITARLQSIGAAPTCSGDCTGTAAAAPEPVCSDGVTSQRGFQILGPEGWRTFDQSERLIMAMSSSGKPLLGAMRELAGRVLREQPGSADVLLPVMEERLRVSRARRALDNAQATDLDGEARLDAVIRAFDGDEQ